MCAFNAPPGESEGQASDRLSRNSHSHPALKQLYDQQFGITRAETEETPSRNASPSRFSSDKRGKHRSRPHRFHYNHHNGSQSDAYDVDMVGSPSILGGRHNLSRDNRSLQDLNVLGRLLDDRTGCHEDKRASDDFLAEVSKRKNGSELKSYYERMNSILDGWREVDEILDSRFPEEVMLRFGTVEEVERFQGTRKRLPWIDNSFEDDAENDSGYQEESESGSDDEALPAHRRSSIARAASALSGLWFGTPSKSRNTGVQKDEESALFAESDQGVTSERSPRYGSTKSPAKFSNLTTIDDENHTSEPSSRKKITSPPRAGTVRSTTPSGVRPKALENGAMAAKLEAKSNSKQSKVRTGGGKFQLQPDNSSSDDEMEREDTNESEPIAAGRMDREIAEERSERKSRARKREFTIPGSGTKVKIDKGDRSLSSAAASGNRDQSVGDPNAKKSQPGGTSERNRMRLLKYVPQREEREGEKEREANFAININLAVNVLLLAGKVIAVFSSNSVSLIASLVDSALDLLSTLIIFGTSKAISYRSFHTYFKYPVVSCRYPYKQATYICFKGKKRFEPLGVVVFAVLMIASFCQVLVESVERLHAVVQKGGHVPETAKLPFVGIAFMVLTIIIKTFMWLIYRKSPSSGVRAVAQDAENDVVFNVASLIFPVIGSKFSWPALDPIGGICLSIYIIAEWLDTLTETVSKLTGAAGTSQDISRALYLVLRFRSINSISAFEMYHAGDDMIVEADVVLPHALALKEAHDLGEIIVYSTEMLGGIERAYVVSSPIQLRTHLISIYSSIWTTTLLAKLVISQEEAEL